MRRRSRSVVAFARAISAASMTVAAAPSDAVGSGDGLGRDDDVGGDAGAGRRRGLRERREESRRRGRGRGGTRRRGKHGTPPFRWPRPPIGKERRARRAEAGAAATSRAPEKATLKRCSSGRSPGSRIVRARPLPGGATGLRRSLAASGISPGASPVTVAGAARESHPLPSFTPRRSRGLEDDVKERRSRVYFFCLLFGFLSASRSEAPKTETDGADAFSRLADSSR